MRYFRVSLTAIDPASPAFVVQSVYVTANTALEAVEVARPDFDLSVEDHFDVAIESRPVDQDEYDEAVIDAAYMSGF